MGFFDKMKKQTQGNTKDLDDSSDDKKIVSELKKKYQRSYDSKSSLHKTWDNCMKAYTGEYFKTDVPDYKANEISNYIFSTIETIKPIMLAENPKILALPSSAEMKEKSDLVQKALDYEWQRTKMFQTTANVLTNYLVYGTYIEGILWDATSQNGLGNVKPVIISPFNFFPDPNATCMDDASYVIYACYKNVDDVIQSYPEKEEDLKKESQIANDNYLNYGKDSSSGTNNQVLYLEGYLRDYATLEEQQIDEDGKQIIVKKAKYPNGRRIVVAGDVLLEDGENPYQDGKFPFIVAKCYEIPGQFFGMGEVEQIISPLKHASDIMNSIIESSGLMGNPVWILDKNSGVEKNTLTNRKGLVIRKNPGTEIRRESPPPLPAYMENIVDVLKKDIEHISGVYDVTRGERPSGITAAAAIQALNEQAQGRIKLKVQMLEQTLGETGGMWLSRIQQFWVTQRTIRVMGSDYQAQYYDISGDDIDGDFDIVIAAGSTLPVNKTAKLQQLIQLAQTPGEDGLPMVDRQTILENSDLPDVQQILVRFKELKAQQEQAQAQAQQQTQGQMKSPSESISFKDLPIEGQIQMAQQAGIQLLPQHLLHQQQMQLNNQMQMNEHSSSLQMQQRQQQTMQQQNNNQNAEGNGENPQGQSNQDPMQNIMDILSQLPPEEVRKLIKEDPRIAQIFSQLKSNNPNQ